MLKYLFTVFLLTLDMSAVWVADKSFLKHKKMLNFLLLANSLKFHKLRALLKTCCLKMPADFRDRKTAKNIGILSYFEAFCRFYGRKGVWQVRTLRFLEVPLNCIFTILTSQAPSFFDYVRIHLFCHTQSPHMRALGRKAIWIGAKPYPALGFPPQSAPLQHLSGSAALSYQSNFRA